MILVDAKWREFISLGPAEEEKEESVEEAEAEEEEQEQEDAAEDDDEEEIPVGAWYRRFQGVCPSYHKSKKVEEDESTVAMMTIVTTMRTTVTKMWTTVTMMRKTVSMLRTIVSMMRTTVKMVRTSVDVLVTESLQLPMEIYLGILGKVKMMKSGTLSGGRRERKIS